MRGTVSSTLRSYQTCIVCLTLIHGELFKFSTKKVDIHSGDRFAFLTVINSVRATILELMNNFSNTTISPKHCFCLITPFIATEFVYERVVHQSYWPPGIWPHTMLEWHAEYSITALCGREKPVRQQSCPRGCRSSSGPPSNIWCHPPDQDKVESDSSHSSTPKENLL